MRPLEALVAWLVILATLIIFASAPPGPLIDWTDTGVGCIDDCLEPIDTSADAEPIRADQEDRP